MRIPPYRLDLGSAPGSVRGTMVWIGLDLRLWARPREAVTAYGNEPGTGDQRRGEDDLQSGANRPSRDDDHEVAEENGDVDPERQEPDPLTYKRQTKRQGRQSQSSPTEPDDCVVLPGLRILEPDTGRRITRVAANERPEGHRDRPRKGATDID